MARTNPNIPTVNIITQDPTTGYILEAECDAAIPTTAGLFAASCEMFRLDNGLEYVNTGTTASPVWSTIGTITAGSVNLAALASGITPSHVVKYAGTSTLTNASATKAETVAGVLSTDIVLATILVNGGGTKFAIVSVVPTTDTITFTVSSNATTGDKISYQVLRAAA